MRSRVRARTTEIKCHNQKLEEQVRVRLNERLTYTTCPTTTFKSSCLVALTSPLGFVSSVRQLRLGLFAPKWRNRGALESGSGSGQFTLVYGCVK